MFFDSVCLDLLVFVVLTLPKIVELEVPAKSDTPVLGLKSFARIYSGLNFVFASSPFLQSMLCVRVKSDSHPTFLSRLLDCGDPRVLAVPFQVDRDSVDQPVFSIPHAILARKRPSKRILASPLAAGSVAGGLDGPRLGPWPGTLPPGRVHAGRAAGCVQVLNDEDRHRSCKLQALRKEGLRAKGQGPRTRGQAASARHPGLGGATRRVVIRTVWAWRARGRPG